MINLMQNLEHGSKVIQDGISATFVDSMDKFISNPKEAKPLSRGKVFWNRESTIEGEVKRSKVGKAVVVESESGFTLNHPKRESIAFPAGIFVFSRLLPFQPSQE